MRPYGGDLRDAARLVATATAILSFGAAVIHLSAASDHENLPVMLAGFIVVAVLQAALGALLLWRRPSRLLCLAAVGLMAGAVGVWLVSRTVGLPFLPGGHMEPIGFKDGVTVLFELASLPALLLLMSRELDRVALPSPALGSNVVAIAGAMGFALLVPAFLLDGGGHHAAGEMAGHAHGGETATAEAGHGHAGGGHGTPSAQAGHAHGKTAAAAAAGHGGAAHDLMHSSPSRGATPSHGHGAAPNEVAQRNAGGHAHGGGGSAPAADGEAGHGHAEQPGGHAEGGGHEGGGGGDGDGGAGEGGLAAGYSPAEPASNGRPARGSQIYVRRGPEQDEGGHHRAAPCNPTPEQRAAAADLQRRTAAALRKYDNNPLRAAADGFHLAFRGAGTPDRFVHLFNEERVYDTPGTPMPSAAGKKGEPVILDPARIESFMYAMTDKGLTAIGGMYLMPADYDEAKGDLLRPRAPFAGPEIGGCITRWHDHPELGRATNRSAAPTPQMLHVWTLPGLDPYGELDAREASQLWTIGSVVPDIYAPLNPVQLLFGDPG